jgi:hypothetical protein
MDNAKILNLIVISLLNNGYSLYDCVVLPCPSKALIPFLSFIEIAIGIFHLGT